MSRVFIPDLLEKMRHIFLRLNLNFFAVIFFGYVFSYLFHEKLKALVTFFLINHKIVVYYIKYLKVIFVFVAFDNSASHNRHFLDSHLNPQVSIFR